MRLQPRLQTLEIWRAVAGFSYPDGEWKWGGRYDRNSISDAEQLLCLMYPAADVSNLAVDKPDATSEDVLEALRPLGNRTEIPKVLIDVLADYMSTYRTKDGTPVFSGDTYFAPVEKGVELTAEQRALDVVDSFAMSISLALSTLGFLRVFNRSVHKPLLKQRIADLEAATSARLTAAMIGLLRSFAVNVFDADSEQGRVLLSTLNQEALPNRSMLDELRRTLQPIRVSLREATLGLSQDEALEDEDTLFECGWSWGVTHDAPPVVTTASIGVQPDGVALSAPFLYFTVVALDGINDLFSDRTRILGLLNTEQQNLAQALQLRWDITLAYWSRMARFGKGKWPLEDIPWRTTDNEESTYFSLLVSAVVLLDLLARRATDDDLTRTVAILEELAIRGRVNRRVTRGDSATLLHVPGVRIELSGAEKLGSVMSWVVSDYAALLLKRAVRAAELSRNSVARERLLTVAEESLTHLWRRRLTGGEGSGLWDDPGEVFPGVEGHYKLPTWSLTERIIESLVIAAAAVGAAPIRSTRLQEIAGDLLGEADHLFNQEQLQTSRHGTSPMNESLQRIENKLSRARTLLQERPGTATAIVIDVLRELDEFAVARQDALRSAE
ncbi:MAG: SCO2524 family protein [Actinophytocola sp.]|uniref:SCO2524 family protein n=1 Tax=Actinophytocola sp. TaxID=1872138 RepID=UPI003C757DCD